MCGLVGVFKKEDRGFDQAEMDAFKNSMYINSMRGSHASGVCSIYKDGGSSWFKVIGGPGTLLNHQDWIKWAAPINYQGKGLFGHGRYATRGSADDLKCAHPFEVKINEQGSLILAHNGTLPNYQVIDKPSIHAYKVDSHWLAAAIAKLGPEETLSQVNGAIATIWYNTIEKKMYVYRNNERPLHYAYDAKGNLFINSELEALCWLKARCNLTYDFDKIKSFEEKVLYSFDPAGWEFTEKKIERKPYVFQGRPVENSSYPGSVNVRYGAAANTYSRDDVNAFWKEVIVDLELGNIDRVTFEFGVVSIHIAESWVEKYPHECFISENIKLKLMESGINSKGLRFVGKGGEVFFMDLKEAEETIDRRFPKKKEKALVFNFKSKLGNRSVRHRMVMEKVEQDKNYIELYHNSLDGKFKAGDVVDVEVESVKEGAMQGGYRMLTVTCSSVKPEASGMVIYWFYPPVGQTKEEILKIGFFTGEIAWMRKAKEEDAKLGAIVEVFLRNVKPFGQDVVQATGSVH